MSKPYLFAGLLALGLASATRAEETPPAKLPTKPLAKPIAAPVVPAAPVIAAPVSMEWKQPTAEQVKTQLDAWLTEAKADAAIRAAADKTWAEFAPPPGLTAGPALLERTVQAIAAADPVAKQLYALCQKEHQHTKLPEFLLLQDKAAPRFVAANLRLYYGRWLALHRLYDEAAHELADLKTEDVADPGTLLFYQAVVAHRLLDKPRFDIPVKRLSGKADEVPRRYIVLVRLMEADFKGFKPDSPDEIARMMDDIQRRLDLGRAGKKVQDKEEDVIGKLDKLIKKLEDQQKQQQSSSSSGGATTQPTAPAQDSVGGGPKGPGDVDPKNMADKRDWGNITKKEQDKVLQQVGESFPPHYRTVIEEYFHRLAKEGPKKK